MQIGEELCDRFLKGDYQYVLAVHTDHDHIHCHIIFNNTNLYNGLSFTTEHNQGKVSERSWAQLRAISDELCRENGLSIIEPKGKGVSHFERDMQIQGKSWKDKLRAKIAEVAFYSRDFADFLQNCTASGIEYVYKPSNKVKLKFRLSGEGQQKFTRADTLGEDYTAERIAEQIEQIQKARSVMERLAEKKKPEKAVTPPKPTVTPKTEPTVTAPTKPTAAEPTKSKGLTDEEFLALLDEKSAENTSAPNPTESKPIEKKEDVWASIRNMPNADSIIVQLKSVGITSFSQFGGFMHNIHQPDDHTKEIAELKAQYTVIDKLTAMMKQRADNSAVYKEYKGKSVFTQNHFRKKNAAAIHSYEEAAEYIKEHIKEHYIDGKAPKRSELEALSKELKEKREALMPEQKGFLIKRDTALKYTRQVRQYLNEQHMKREREKSRQRTQTKQKNKNTI
ncbi:MAG: relaxase/mobilization nuclease domain-containing protein [Ruminococcus sp.]|nr:relaxase/mobilization nuclease domain-containing protein [Ruminococcus sp.]